MKITWEAEDIRGGRIVGKKGREERWLIIRLEDGMTHKYALASMADGMVICEGRADHVATRLNDSGDIPVEWIT